MEYGKTIVYIQGEMHSIHLGADSLGFWGNLGYYLSVFYDQTGPVIAHFRTGMPHRFELAAGPVHLDAVVVDIDEETGMARSIARIAERFEPE